MAEPRDMRTPGELLAEARAARGLSLETVATATKIAPRLLQAIERDEYHKISGSLYVRSFLRAYADAVGLDSHDIVSLYELHSGRDRTAEGAEQVWEEERASVRAVGVPYGHVLLRYVLPAALAVLVVAVGIWLARRPGDAPSSGRSVDSLLPERPPAMAAPAGSLGRGAADSLAAFRDNSLAVPADSAFIAPDSTRAGAARPRPGITGGG
jgi:cytoskeleton protein RodZ